MMWTQSTAALLLPLLLLLAADSQSAAAASAPNLYADDLSITDSEGKTRHIREFRGKVLLVVNVASQCGFTDTNYRGLQELHSRYAGQGLQVLAFPCNQFGNQEPGSRQEIASFARGRYQAGFPLMDKVEVNGPGAAPIFSWLKANTPVAPGEQRGADIGWNFVKFLVARDGSPAKRYAWDFQKDVIERDLEALLAEPAPHAEL